MSETTLSVDLAVPGRVTASFALNTPAVVAIIGPNGAGKSSLLHAIAGLVQSDGSVLVGAESYDASTPPWRRAIGWCSQQASLLPHLTGAGNVAFAAAHGRRPRSHHRQAAYALLERFDVAHRADNYPSEVSGGEAARIALARAFAVGRPLVLLDEPFAAVDAASRAVMRKVVAAIATEQNASVLMVTHDIADAVALAERWIVIEDGVITHDGSASSIAAQPTTPFAAEWVGLNLWHGIATGTSVSVLGGATLHLAEPASGDVVVTVHPRAVALHRSAPTGSPRNTGHGTIQAVDSTAFGHARVHIDGALSVIAEVTDSSVEQLELRPGQVIHWAFKATELSVS